jgi:hypothetical protein
MKWRLKLYSPVELNISDNSSELGFIPEPPEKKYLANTLKLAL